MAKVMQWHLQCGPWRVGFSPRSATLDCRHASGARVRGMLAFRATYKGECDTWRITPTHDGTLDRLALEYPEGDCAGYVTFDADGDALRLAVVKRARMVYEGKLTFTATARLGKRTFACRTRIPPRRDVVQFASGPADSALNDSLFDIDRDTALRFDAEQCAITTRESDDAHTTSDVELAATTEHAARATITLTLERDYYRDRYAPWYRPIDKTHTPEAPTGWMSWNVYFDTAGEKENLDEARIASKYLRPYGLRTWLIESWQDNSPTQPCRKFSHLTLRPFAEQFPHGMKWLSKEIRKLGLSPGIWVVPFGTGDAEFYAAHRDWFLHEADGAPMWNWCGLYVLDPTNRAAQRHVTEQFRVMAEAWDYDLFKIDGMSNSAPSYSGMFYERPEVRAAFSRPVKDPYAQFIKTFRKGVGKKPVILACGGSYTCADPTISQAARIGHDVVKPGGPPTWEGTLHQVTSTLANVFTNNIIWYTDPDTLLFVKPPLKVARVVATVAALPGQVTLAGDKLAQLTPEKMWLLQRVFPVCDVRPLDLHPIYDLPRVWTLKVRRPFATWDVVSLFNYDAAEARTVAVRMTELGLDAQTDYLAYDFWKQRLIGRVKGRISLRLAAKSNALLALHPALDRPQFLSTDRHLTQGAVSLKSMRWNEKRQTLSGVCDLVEGETSTLVFHMPKGHTLGKATARGARATATKTHRDGTLRMTLLRARAGCARWSITFDRTESTS